MNTLPALPSDESKTVQEQIHWHLPWATLAVALLAVAVQAWPAAQGMLEYNRVAVLGNELWRLWSAHAVHFGPSHLWWNLAVFVVAGIWLEELAPIRLRLLLFLAPLAIGVTLLAGDAALARYAGLSGVGSGVLTLLALTQLGRPDHDRLIWRAVLAAIALKIGLEVIAERPLFAEFDDATIHAVPLAHLGGAAVALAIHLAWRWTHRPAEEVPPLASAN